VLIDKSGSVSFQSPSVERITGYTLKNLQELTLGSLNHPTDRRDDITFFAKLIASPGSSVRKTHRLKTKDGQYIWIDGTYTNLLHEDGINSIVYIFSDITEIKITELALRASEGKYRFLFDNNPLPLWIFELDSLRILEVNTSAISHYGYSREEFLSMTIKDIRPEEDAVRIEQIDRTIPRIDTQMLGEWRHRKKNGKIIYVSLAGYEIDYQGRRAMIIISIDITDRYLAEQKLKESHQRLIKLTHKVPPAIYEFEIDPNGKMWFRFMSKGIELIWPKVKARDIVRAPVTEFSLVHNEDIERFTQSIRESYKELKDWEIEFRTHKRTGAVKWIQASARPERKPDGGVTWYGYMQDISNLKKTEETLRELNEDLRKQAEELAASNQELERFAYVASHDLQEPLRMVSSFLQLLEKKYNRQLDAQAQQYIHFAVDGAERMKQLILDLLAYSRLGTQAQPFESVNLNLILEDVRASLKSLIQENHVTIHVQTLPTVHAIRTQMFQLFQNLISNAVKYRKPDQTPQIHIRSRENTAYWYMEIEDNGIGIDERFYDKIFIVFQRLHNRSEHSGTGIGLAICKKIVERHGGSIGVNSQPGKGSTFYFSIPKFRS
jgi:two-component system CheB/CheR fusion protein